MLDTMRTQKNYKKFTKEQRSSFSYWFWHWLAFNDTAKKYGVWKFHHLFHDIEKPFLRLFLPYEKVQSIHRRHNKHHLEYKKHNKINWIDLVIDWECSHLTKYASPRNSIDEANSKRENGEMSAHDFHNFLTALNKIMFNN